jgi:hypothetical protein
MAFGGCSVVCVLLAFGSPAASCRRDQRAPAVMGGQNPVIPGLCRVRDYAE